MINNFKFVMTKQTSRRHARKIWAKYYKASILPGMHLHHIDGDCFNNHIDNLLVCSAEEHWQIHFEQGDQVALYGKFVQGASDAGRKGGLVAMLGKKHKSETIEFYKKTRKGKDNSFYGKAHSDETKKLISEKAKGRPGYWKGKKLSTEVKQKISISRTGVTAGKMNPKWKGFTVTPFGRFETSYVAAETLKVSRRTINRRCGSSDTNYKGWYYER